MSSGVSLSWTWAGQSQGASELWPERLSSSSSSGSMSSPVSGASVPVTMNTSTAVWSCSDPVRLVEGEAAEVTLGTSTRVGRGGGRGHRGAETGEHL